MYMQSIIHIGGMMRVEQRQRLHCVTGTDTGNTSHHDMGQYLQTTPGPDTWVPFHLGPAFNMGYEEYRRAGYD